MCIRDRFLIGKLLSNNLINLGIYDEVKETLEKNGKSLAEIEEIAVSYTHLDVYKRQRQGALRNDGRLYGGYDSR